MQLFDGFDKKELIYGTSLFYIATLALIIISIMLNQYLPLRKSNDVHKQNILNSITGTTFTQSKKISINETPLGYSSRVLLDNETNLSMVANHLELIMQNNEFAAIYYVLNCSKVDCKVSFTAKEDDKRELTKLANERFISIWQ